MRSHRRGHARRRVRVHPYLPDHVADHPGGGDRCQICGLPRGNECHRAPPPSAERAAFEARRLGEHLTVSESDD